MTAHLPNATRRLRIGLSVDGEQQFVQLRVADTLPSGWQSLVATEFKDWLLILLDGNLFEGDGDKSQIDIVNLAAAAIGSDFFLPFSASVIGEVQAGSPSSATALTKASLFSFSGRSAGGGARFFLRGLHGLSETSELDDYRISTAENINVLGAINSLNDSAVGFGQYLVGTDNMPVLFWKPYMNVSISRRYVNRVRYT